GGGSGATVRRTGSDAKRSGIQRLEGQQEKEERQEKEEMSRVLLADDNSHAQRMGEQILREEGYEVISVADGETAAARIAALDPDVVIADTALPKRSGFDLCRWVKSQPAHKHIKVVFAVG